MEIEKSKTISHFFSGGGPSSCSKTHGQSNKTRRSRNRGSPGLEWLFLRDIKQILGKMLSMKRKEWRPQSFKERVKKLRTGRNSICFPTCFAPLVSVEAELQACGADARAALNNGLGLAKFSSTVYWIMYYWQYIDNILTDGPHLTGALTSFWQPEPKSNREQPTTNN